MVSVAMQAVGLTLGLKHPHSKARSVVCIYNLDAEEAERGDTGAWWACRLVESWEFMQARRLPKLD